MKHIGLVLSGGMGKGAYQIGALKALNDYFKPSDFEYVSAASIGALNAYAYLTNNLEQAHDIWKSLNLQGSKRFITSVLKSSFLQETIESLVSDRKISNLFYVPLLDLAKRELDYYNFANIATADIGRYLQASIAMPFYNKGITIQSRTLFDGAVVDNIPVLPILKKKLDYVICIYFDDSNYVFENGTMENKIIKLTFPDNKIISNSVYIKHESIMSMIDEGYEKTKQVLSHIFAEGTDNIEVIQKKILEQNLSCPHKALRITGDVVVTNMNKVLKKLVRQNQSWTGESIPKQIENIENYQVKPAAEEMIYRDANMFCSDY